VRYNVVPEYISCVLLALIGVYILSDKRAHAQKETVFQASLLLSLIAIISNIASIYVMENAERMPELLIDYLNAFYFFSVALMTAMISITTYVVMFEGRHDELRLKTAIVISLFYFILEIALVLMNLERGQLFHIYEGRFHQIDSLNLIGILFLIIAIISVVWFGILERKHVKRSFRLILFILPALAVIIGVIQFYFPQTIMTGTIISFSLLALFIAGKQQRARVDALTELSDREAFFYDIRRLCKKNIPYKVIVIGLKNFKQVNGQLGQRAGDAMICAVSDFLMNLEPRVMAYRISGVQFTLLVKEMDQVEYEALFQTVVARFSQTWKTGVYNTELHAIFADVQSPEHAVGVDEVSASLEYATRLAKQSANGRPIRFSDQLKNQFMRRNFVISQMEKALKQDLFYLNIQPVFDIELQRFAGGEVLLRLNEDSGMPISPGEFIPIAIETGIATKLGLMVMEKACKFLQENQDLDIGWLSINISSQQDEFDETVHHMEMLLDQYGVAPERIKLEITELVLLEDLDRAHATMDELNRRGIGVYLDDFGTGYSNLVNVMTLPFECVKIDKGFIRNVATHPKSRGMLQTLVQGLRSMNVIALAEGVENEEQDDIVREMGIDRIQGFYYARPMPLEEFVWLINQRSPIKTKPAN